MTNKITIQPTTTRFLFIDILKIVAIILIITTHTVGFKMPIESIAVPLFLVITGFNMANSMKKKNQTLKDYYTAKNLWAKIKRFLYPYLALVVVEFVVLLCRKSLTLGNSLILIFGGGLGDGGYYTPLMLQIILLFPLIFALIKKNKNYILLLFAINFAFEIIINVLCPNIGLVRQIYRFAIFRQIFYISAGCYMCFYQGKLEDILCIMFACVGLFFYSAIEFGTYTPIILKSWTTTTIPFGILAISTVYFCTKQLDINYYSPPIVTWSNATYHIFLCQQLFFWLFKQNDIASSPLFNIILCCTAGIIFYLLQNLISKHIKSHKHKKLIQK